MFLKFQSTEERRAYGGSAYVELQYCHLPAGTPDKKIVSLRSIEHWSLSSLFIHAEDLNDFYGEYCEILGQGLYNNRKTGTLDLFGINYYDAERTKEILEKLSTQKPKEFERFQEWLEDDPTANGFYILGI